jgi:hypothetical protein
MKPHFSEADLLETYYTQPGEAMPVMMHLADCSECAARYERLERKVRALGACAHDEKPETFWARQRLAVMRKIDSRRGRTTSASRVLRMAAAAVFVLMLGALITWNRAGESTSRPVVQETTLTASAAPLDDSKTRRLDDSPWQSEELQDYSSMVAWESWVEDGDQSL